MFLDELHNRNISQKGLSVAGGGDVIMVDLGTYLFHLLTQDTGFALILELCVLFFLESLLHLNTAMGRNI